MNKEYFTCFLELRFKSNFFVVLIFSIKVKPNGGLTLKMKCQDENVLKWSKAKFYKATSAITENPCVFKNTEYLKFFSWVFSLTLSSHEIYWKRFKVYRPQSLQDDNFKGNNS
jgi:hypothetical protein